MRFLLAFLLFLPAFCANLTSYNIYDRNERVDVMLVFDSVYEGKIEQKQDENHTLITFFDLSSKIQELKNLNSTLVDKFSISSENNATYLMFQNRTKTSFQISSINNKFGVRIRVLEDFNESNLGQDFLENSQNSPKENQFNALNFNNSNEKNIGASYSNYFLVLAVLLGLFLFLWWFKSKFSKKSPFDSADFQILFQKPLDKNNRFVILRFENERYTLIIGTSNVLLESKEFKENEDFEQLFENIEKA